MGGALEPMAKKPNKPAASTDNAEPLPGSAASHVGYLNLPEDKIGERIKKRREELRINFEELSRLTARYDAPEYKKGLTAAMLARYEKGLEGKPVLPGARELRLLCAALDVSPDWLLLGINREDQAKYAVEIAELVASLLKHMESYSLLGRSAVAAKSGEHAEKLYEVRRPKGGTGEKTD